MTNPIQGNLNEKLLKKRKESHKNYGKIKIRYNVMHEHNYFYTGKIKNVQRPEKVNHTEKITNDCDECDSILDLYRNLSSSDEEEDIKDMSLSHLLKIELEKDLLKEYKNKKSSKNQLHDELNNKNNHNLLNISNISNDSNNVISENHLINNGEQSTILQIVPLTNNELVIQNQNITNESQKTFGQSCKELVVNNNYTYIGLLPNVSTNENNHNLLNISNDSNNVISENHLINNGEQSTILQIVPLTNDELVIQNQNITNESQKTFGQSCKELVVNNNYTYIGLLPNVSMNEKARTDYYNSNMQNYFLNFSLDTNNQILERETQSSYNNVNVTKTSANNVCPPLHWIHLIYLAIKNSATENVSCYDIQRFVRYWFPYFNKKSYIRIICITLNHTNNFGEKYFYCNSFPIDIDENDTWTINSFYVQFLEKELINTVKNNEDKIKSAMTNPGKLSTMINGYGVFYLGFSQNL